MKSYLYFIPMLLFFSCAKVICPEPIPMDTKININGKSKIDDACIAFLAPDNNYKSITYNYTGCWSYSPNIEFVDFFIKFDYSQIPSTALIKSAKINFYADTSFAFSPVKGHYSSNNLNSFRISRVETDWADSTITWNTEPQVSSTDIVLLNRPTSNKQNYLGIDVTSIVQKQMEHGNFGFEVRLVDYTIYNRVTFYSSDSPYTQFGPSISIEYSH